MFDPTTLSEDLPLLISSIGENIQFLDNGWFVYTNLDAKQLYDKLDHENKLAIIIMDATESVYWGRMEKEIWSWLKNKNKAISNSRI